jgi:hypothetical protein
MTPDPIESAMNDLNEAVRQLEEAEEFNARGQCGFGIVMACAEKVVRLRARYNRLIVAYDDSGI